MRVSAEGKTGWRCRGSSRGIDAGSVRDAGGHWQGRLERVYGRYGWRWKECIKDVVGGVEAAGEEKVVIDDDAEDLVRSFHVL